MVVVMWAVAKILAKPEPRIGRCVAELTEDQRMYDAFYFVIFCVAVLPMSRLHCLNDDWIGAVRGR